MKEFRKDEKVHEIVKKAFKYKTISFKEIKSKLQKDFSYEKIETLINGLIEKGITIEYINNNDNHIDNLENYKFEEYVNYLNSLHNANAANENAIAESQVQNKFYKEINVKRITGDKIKNLLVKKNCTVILTGHAGDGKTSILAQILNDLGLFKYGEELKSYATENIKGKKLFYVKDMSELSEEKQYEFLKKGIETTYQNNSSIIIANTGPLIKNLKKYYSDEIENEILEKMDKSNGDYLSVENKNDKILIVNIARIDNTLLIGKLLEKFLNPKLWSNGKEKFKESFIYKNLKLMSNNIDNLKEFITTYYKYMYENGERFTLRQIIAHLTFSITGNYQPHESIGKDFIKHNFANHFFGYNGYIKNEIGLKIKGIESIYKLGLDKKRTFLDKEIFINENFDKIDFEIKDLLELKWKELLGEFNQYDKNEYTYLTENKNIRRMIRRFFILFNSYNENENENIKKELFGEVFIDYLAHSKHDKKIEKNIEKMVFNSLFRIFTGHTPQNESNLYLTLKRDGEYLQNVQLIIGEVNKKNIKIRKEIEQNCFFEQEKYVLKLYFKDIKKSIILSYPILQYFSDMNDGVIKTALDPHLSHGIDRIKSKIISWYSEEEEETKFFVLTNKGSKILDLDIRSDEIIIDC